MTPAPPTEISAPPTAPAASKEPRRNPSIPFLIPFVLLAISAALFVYSIGFRWPGKLPRSLLSSVDGKTPETIIADADALLAKAKADHALALERLFHSREEVLPVLAAIEDHAAAVGWRVQVGFTAAKTPDSTTPVAPLGVSLTLAPAAAVARPLRGLDLPAPASPAPSFDDLLRLIQWIHAQERKIEIQGMRVASDKNALGNIELKLRFWIGTNTLSHGQMASK